MKKTNLRILTLLVALAMLVCCFTACKSAPKEDEAVLDEEISGTGTVTHQDVENDAPAVVDDEDVTVKGPDESTRPTVKDDDPSEADDPDDSKDPSEGDDPDDSKDPGDSKDPDDGKDPADGDDPADEDDPKDDIEKNYSDHFIVATYNVQSFGSEEEYDGIAKEIRELGPAIIGLQELDYLNPRHNKEDQLKILAEKAGYQYFKFTPAYSENYGTGVMSKYPIKEHTVTMYENQFGEDRSFSRSVIDMDGKTVHFYNTHLCLGDKGEQALQLGEIIKMIKQKGDKNVVITGDMNTNALSFIKVFSEEEYVALNGGPTFLADRNTFPAGDKPTRPIDNIIVSTDWDYYLEEDPAIGILVSYSKWSDHNMAYTYLKFKG